MPRKVTPAQYNRMVDDYNRKLKQSVDKFNREVTAHNRKVKRAIDDYNRDVRAHNARVRSNRQRLNAEIARLNRQRSTTRYVTVQTSTIALHTAYSHVDEQSALWNERGQELADLAEAETANSAYVANTLLDETAADAEETEETSLTDELSALSLDLHNRWEGARFAINPRNPDAARHFCTSAREVIVELINMKAPDAAVLQAKPNCERGPDGKAVARREKIGYLLDLNGASYEALGDFIDTNVNDVMNLFSQFNKGTHGSAGRFDIPTLRTIKHRVEDSIRFLSTLVRGASR
ncbi:pPIWI-associating nuclease domain-containing protein [Microbispora bryophytorum]|uniref:pPIWI-associating nuclease domain-containing protein n=1 Tax=Microbispora bryophytorum TaxID=1460882 RepID=UPI003715B45B